MKHLMVRAGLLLTLLALGAVARAVQEPHRVPLPNFDQREQAAAAQGRPTWQPWNSGGAIAPSRRTVLRCRWVCCLRFQA